MRFPQTATWWSRTGVDRYGRRGFSAPQTISVRWETRTKIEFRFETDNEEAQRSARNVIYTDANDIEIGDFVYLGTSNESSPTDQDGALQVVDAEKIPNLRGTAFLRKVLA